MISRAMRRIGIRYNTGVFFHITIDVCYLQEKDHDVPFAWCSIKQRQSLTRCER